MTAYQVMPGLTADEYADLRDDIAANGVRVPIDVDENGQVLDGHHRALIAAELGVECPRRALSGLSEDEKVAHAYAVNIQRRSLTREQKRALVQASLRRDPQLSDREHGKRTGVDGKTVAGIREGLEATAEIPQSTERTGADGRTRPATQPTRPADWSCHCGAAFKSAHTHCGTCGEHYPEPVHCPEHTVAVDTTTGEVLDGPTPRATPRKPLTDQFFDAAYDLSKVADRIERLAADDRFPQNAEKVAAKYRSDLVRAIDALQGVLDRLPSA